VSISIRVMRLHIRSVNSCSLMTSPWWAGLHGRGPRRAAMLPRPGAWLFTNRPLRCLRGAKRPTPSTTGGTMGAKQELLQQAEQEYDGLKAAIKGLDEPQMSEVWLGTWGVREILAHAAGWHREMIPALERLGRGEPPYPEGAYDDFDSWNARFVEA